MAIRQSMRLEMGFQGAEWMRSVLKRKPNASVMSPLGEAVADCIGFVFRGIYHLPLSSLLKPDWSDPHHIRVATYQELATWDGDLLTRIVVVAHDMRLRAAVESAGPRYTAMNFWQRRAEGSIFERQPTIEEQIDRIRRGYRVVDPSHVDEARPTTTDDGAGSPAEGKCVSG